MEPGSYCLEATPLNCLVQNSKIRYSFSSLNPKSRNGKTLSRSSNLPSTNQFSNERLISWANKPVVVVELASKGRGPDPLISTSAKFIFTDREGSTS